MTKNELLTMLGLSEKEILDILKPVRTKKTNEEKTLIQVMNLVVEKRNEIPILSNFKIDKTNIRGTDMENQLILKNIIDSNVQTTVHINNLEMVLKNECKLIEIPIDIKEYKNNLPSGFWTYLTDNGAIIKTIEFNEQGNPTNNEELKKLEDEAIRLREKNKGKIKEPDFESVINDLYQNR